LNRESVRLMIEDELEVVGRRVRYFRKRRGWTHEQLGVKANIHHMRVRRMEWGRHLCPLMIRRLAKALEVEVDALFPGGSRTRFVAQFGQRNYPVCWGENGWDAPIKGEIFKVR
jgi:transcriptional regulator with XRE-family HTH domain